MRTTLAALGGLLVALRPVAAQDLVQEIAALTPGEVHSHAQMLSELLALRSTGRVSVMRFGVSVAGRDIVGVAVHDPATQFGQGKRLFVIARQHGSEVSGTEAVLALVRHFALGQGEVEREMLQRLTVIAVPMANPDGAAANRRCNANGADLNRDWAALSQPETAAIDRAARIWQPHAVMDLHELPASSGKAEYQESFVETIGSGGGIPRAESAMTVATGTALAAWTRQYGQRANVYYDQPGQDARLCHRHFGLTLGVPSFLVEAKNGPGRSLQHRVALHVLAMLVVANHLVRGGGAGPSLPAPEGLEPPPIPVAQAGAEEPAGPVTLQLQPATAEGGVGESGRLEAVVGGAGAVRFVRFYVDGYLKLLSNVRPYTVTVSGAAFSAGEHEVVAEAVGERGEVLARASAKATVEARELAGE